MIPTKIASDLATLTASVKAATPIKRASPLLKVALVRAGRSLIQDIDAAVIQSAGYLDAEDPTGYAGNLAGYLIDLSTSAYDQASLVDMRGTVGRRVFNLAQGQ